MEVVRSAGPGESAIFIQVMLAHLDPQRTASRSYCRYRRMLAAARQKQDGRIQPNHQAGLRHQVNEHNWEYTSPPGKESDKWLLGLQAVNGQLARNE